MEDIAEGFDPNSVPNDFLADIQFKVSGEEPGNYYFHIENHKCTLHEGIAQSPKATINAPSEVWKAILQGEMKPQQAFFEQKFTVEGDLMQLLQLASLFKQG